MKIANIDRAKMIAVASFEEKSSVSVKPVFVLRGAA